MIVLVITVKYLLSISFQANSSSYCLWDGQCAAMLCGWD